MSARLSSPSVEGVRIDRAVADALLREGVAVVPQAGVPAAELERAYQAWAAFFADPSKTSYLASNGRLDGFFAFASETSLYAQRADPKEFFHYYEWGVCPTDCRQATEPIFAQLAALATAMLDALQEALPPSVMRGLSEPLPQMVSTSPRMLLRVAHYPALGDLAGEYASAALRAAPHRDINLITLFPPATSNGLQIEQRHGGWRDVDIEPPAVGVILGDMFEICTAGRYPGTNHRVVVGTEIGSVARLSLSLFANPKDDVVLTEGRSAQAVLGERLRMLGINVDLST